MFPDERALKISSRYGGQKRRKLLITVTKEFYDLLHEKVTVGRGKGMASNFIEVATRLVLMLFEDDVEPDNKDLHQLIKKYYLAIGKSEKRLSRVIKNLLVLASVLQEYPEIYEQQQQKERYEKMKRRFLSYTPKGRQRRREAARLRTLEQLLVPFGEGSREIEAPDELEPF